MYMMQQRAYPQKTSRLDILLQKRAAASRQSLKAHNPKQSAVVAISETGSPQINRDDSLHLKVRDSLAPRADPINVTTRSPNRTSTEKRAPTQSETSEVAISKSTNRCFFWSIKEVPRDGYAYLTLINGKNEVVKFIGGEYLVFDAKSRNYKPFNVH